MILMFLPFQASYVGGQNEGQNVGSSILTIQATDLDEANSENALVAYAFDDSPDAQFFSIENMTGVISNDVILVRVTV